MLSGVVSGLVLFLLAAFVIDWWIEVRETHKAERVMGVAYKGLAHVVRQEGEYLHALTTGERPRRSPVVPVDADLLEDCVRQTMLVREAHGDVDPASCLFDDAQWRLASHLLVRDLRLSLAVAVAQWASLMAQTPGLAEDLNRVAEAVDKLIPLQRLLRDDRGEQFRSATWREDLEGAFATARYFSVINQEYLHWRINDEDERISPQRKWLTEAQVLELEEEESHWEDGFVRRRLDGLRERLGF